MKSRTALLTVGIGLTLLLAPATTAADSPTASWTISIGIPGTNGWYRGSTSGNYVVLRWDVTDPGNVIKNTSGCEKAITISGPTTGTKRTCTATLVDDSTVAWTTGLIKVDADPPTGLSASIARGPDFNGWYNNPVGINWGGTDATSGIAACTSLTYGGPDGAGAPASGGCTDMAGNTALSPLALNYDATPPALSKVSVASGAGVDVIHWTSTSPSDTVVVERAARGSKAGSTVFRGSGSSFADKKIRSGLEYAYSVQTFDQAGNWSQKTSAVGLPKVLTLRKTPYIPRAAQKPILRWAAVRGATYYNVQLFRGSKRILALWPSGHQVGLPTAWKWAGKRHRLGPGRYRWYVWAGIGRRSFANYKTLGSAQFIVPRR